MLIKEILQNTKHRPSSLPEGKWKFYQEWNDVIFLHWEVNYKELRKIVPQDLEIDLFDNKAWISVVAFSMEKVRPKNLPAFPPLSNFDEINIRTYVKYKGKVGVFFLSIEAGNKLSCQLAKTLSGLPYRFSKMKRRNSRYDSINLQYLDEFNLKFKLGSSRKDKSELDIWLLERYALFQDEKGFINEFDIHHLEWPIQKIEIIKLIMNYPRFQSLFNQAPDFCHYSTGVQVIAWDKKKNRIENTTG